MSALVARIDWRHAGLIARHEIWLFLHLCTRLAMLMLVIAAAVTILSLLVFCRLPCFLRDRI